MPGSQQTTFGLRNIENKQEFLWRAFPEAVNPESPFPERKEQSLKSLSTFLHAALADGKASTQYNWLVQITSDTHTDKAVARHFTPHEKALRNHYLRHLRNKKNSAAPLSSEMVLLEAFLTLERIPAKIVTERQRENIKKGIEAQRENIQKAIMAKHHIKNKEEALEKALTKAVEEALEKQDRENRQALFADFSKILLLPSIDNGKYYTQPYEALLGQLSNLENTFKGDSNARSATEFTSLRGLLEKVNQHNIDETAPDVVTFENIPEKTDHYKNYFSSQKHVVKGKELSYSTLSGQILSDFKKGFAQVNNKPVPFSYDSLNRMLQIHIDRQLGINTEFKPALDPNDKRPWCIRTVDSNKTFKDCLEPDHPVLESDNFLLRALATTRGIDHALAQRSKLIGLSEYYTDQQKLLKQAYNNLLSAVIGLQADYAGLTNPSPADKEQYLNRIKKLEANYNTYLAKVLSENQLARNLHKANDFAKLLELYRNLASTLEPACVVQTITKAGGATFTETSYPITKKTVDQKEAIEKMRLIGQPVTPQDENAHNHLKTPFQEAHSFFVTQLSSDKTALAAQARKMIPSTVKNGWVVHSEVKNDLNGSTKEMWSVRSGTVAYMGSGESEPTMVRHARENLKQIRETVKEISGIENIVLHTTVLNTNSPDNNQRHLLKITRAAVATSFGCTMSNVPINPLGRNFFKPYLSTLFGSPKYQALVNKRSVGKERVNFAAEVTYTLNKGWLTNKKPDSATIDHPSCASGQDRTGVTEEKRKMLFYDDAYYEVMGKKLFDEEKKESVRLEKVALLRGRGLHSAFLATARAPGSFGIKKDSKTDIFPKEVLRYFHGYPSASTNKEPSLNEEAVEANARKRPSVNNLTVNPVLDLLDAYSQKADKRFIDRFFGSSSAKRAALNDLRQLIMDVQLDKPIRKLSYKHSIEKLKEKQDSITVQDVITVWQTEHNKNVLSQQRGFNLFNPEKTRTEKLVEKLKAVGATTVIYTTKQEKKSGPSQAEKNGTSNYGVKETTRMYHRSKGKGKEKEEEEEKSKKKKHRPTSSEQTKLKK